LFYFGQPSAGFFLDRDFFTRSFQFPFSFNLSALGPGVAFFLEWFELFTALFLLTSLNILSLRNWVFIHQSLSFGCFHGENSALAIVQLPIVPEELFPRFPTRFSPALAAHNFAAKHAGMGDGAHTLHSLLTTATLRTLVRAPQAGITPRSSGLPSSRPLSQALSDPLASSCLNVLTFVYSFGVVF
jgi:hypothetical protein